MSTKFRTAFKLTSKTAIQWFPGHMGKGMRQMQQKLKSVDCIIEVHDARIPLSGRNLEFKDTISGLKPHILVLNKKDLADMSQTPKVVERIQSEEGIDHVLFTNCKDDRDSGIKKLMPLARDLIMQSNRFNRAEAEDRCVMVIGVPNVGKSSILNVMRNKYLKMKKASAVGGVAGITKSVMNKIKVCEDPLMYVIDTPGILMPRIGDVETGMKLALCGCFKDHIVGEDVIADYLLFWLNKNQNFKYTELLGLEEPTDDIMEALFTGAKLLNKNRRMRAHDGTLVVPDIQSAAQHLLKAFRTGYFGKINLDADIFR